ncbi:ABC transporter ATP-binding protein [Undibacterium sp. Ji67W]|uniref:ABC transporter ATP-binding protein n=1 Tax=Undibacterium sp. Ji67W TaxID=3413042 RepID=UPI003BF0F5F5
MSSDVVIKVENLSKCYQIYENPSDRLKQMFLSGEKRYKEFWALKEASFEIKRGETVGIIGRNGSGKSTLLQMICGTVTPTTGVVNTKGRLSALLELGAGFNPEFSGRENVILNAEILGFPKSEIQSRMGKILEFSELGSFLDQPVKTYSSGMYSRLAFSIAIHVDPEILVVDEALAVGDARFVAKCMRRIKEIQSQGTTILFVSHDVSSVRTLCERAIWLDKGRLIEYGDTFPVTGRYMEYLFKDEESEEEQLHRQVESINDKGLSFGNDLSSENTELSPDSKNSNFLLDARPVTHWGSCKGIIKSAAVLNKDGEKKDLHPWGESLVVNIELDLPPHISREHLSVAFSIKDLKGTDLIVSTTHDFEEKKFTDGSKFSISFEFINGLTTGKYLLVAAVENRQHNDIHYYEYFEGAHYFASLSEQRFFGIFQPEIDQKIEVCK